MSEQLTERFWYQQIWAGSNRRGTSSEKFKFWCSRTVANADSTRKLDEIPRSNIPLGNERRLSVNYVVDPAIRMEYCLNVVEDNDGTISTPTTAEEIEYSYYISTIVEPYPNWPLWFMEEEKPMASWKVRRSDS